MLRAKQLMHVEELELEVLRLVATVLYNFPQGLGGGVRSRSLCAV